MINSRLSGIYAPIILMEPANVSKSIKSLALNGKCSVEPNGMLLEHPEHSK